MRFVHARERLPNPLPSALSHAGVVVPGFCSMLVIFCPSTVSVENFSRYGYRPIIPTRFSICFSADSCDDGSILIYFVSLGVCFV